MTIKIQNKSIATRNIEDCVNLLDGKVTDPEIVLQAIGYALLDTELFPDEKLYEEECSPISMVGVSITSGDVHRAEAVLMDEMDSYLGGYYEFEVKYLIQQIGRKLIGINLYPFDSE